MAKQGLPFGAYVSLTRLDTEIFIPSVSLITISISTVLKSKSASTALVVSNVISIPEASFSHLTTLQSSMEIPSVRILMSCRVPTAKSDNVASLFDRYTARYWLSFCAILTTGSSASIVRSDDMAPTELLIYPLISAAGIVRKSLYPRVSSLPSSLKDTIPGLCASTLVAYFSSCAS